MAKDIREEIINAMAIVSKQINNNNGISYYERGKITAKNGSIYTVEINQQTYDMKARTGLTLNVDDLVQVIIKNGNFSEKFIDDFQLT